MKRLTLCAMLSICSIASAQSTQPATQPADDFPALRRRLVELQTMIDRLRAELAAVTRERDALLAAASPAPHDARRPASFDDAKRILVAKLTPGLKREEARELLGEPDDTTRSGSIIIDAYRWNTGRDIRGIECQYSERGILLAAFETIERAPRTPKTPVTIGGQSQ